MFRNQSTGILGGTFLKPKMDEVAEYKSRKKKQNNKSKEGGQGGNDSVMFNSPNGYNLDLNKHKKDQTLHK